MNPSTIFIRRPVATVLLSLAIVLSGILAFYTLPVAPLPKIDLTIIVVRANLPGASPETMASTVATPLERRLGQIAGVNEMTSSSDRGSSTIILQFNLNRNIDGAARDVQAAINAARADLPTTLRSNPSYRKVDPGAAPMMILALTSSTLTPSQIYDAASTVLMQRLSQVQGVGEVSLGGASLPAVRIDLDPLTLFRDGIGLDQVRSTLEATNVNRPKGYLSGTNDQWQIGTNDQANKAADYRNVVVAWKNGAPVMLSDIASVSDGVEDTRQTGIYNAQSAVTVTLRPEPNANIIDSLARVKALLPQLKSAMPASIDVAVAMDRTVTIRASLDEIETTMLLSVVLIMLVVFAFLRNIQAALVACATLPLTLLGTFALMYLWGFSLNNFTLMALTIATGFVIDDAIVVIENIMRHIDAGRTSRHAALRSAGEVGFTVMAMSCALVTVFIPMLFMGGIVGRMFSEFAITLTFAVLVSLVVSLTTTPTLASWISRPKHRARQPWPILETINRFFNRIHRGYEKSLAFTLNHVRITLVVLSTIVTGNIALYIIVPKGFFPSQDTGRLTGYLETDQSSSFQSLQPKLEAFSKIIQSDPAVDSVTGFSWGGNGARIFANLKPLDVRKASADDVVNRLRPQLKKISGATLYLSAAQDIKSGGRSSNATYQYTLKSTNLDDLQKWAPKLLRALQKQPELTDVNSDQENKALQLELEIDRDNAARLDVPIRAIDAALYDAFGQRQISNIYTELNQYHVVVQVAPQFLNAPETLKQIYVPASDGTLVPLSSLAHYVTRATKLEVNHQGQFAAATISYNLAPGVSLGQAAQIVTDTTTRIGLPTTIHGSFEGTAKTFEDSFATLPWLLLAALATLYIVLGILYENLVHPFTILSTLPSAGVGAILILLATHTELSVMAFIGIVLLIGIVMKNAIMMIDFAVLAERGGMDPRAAIQYAVSERLRPILMTTSAALLGALPLALGAGIGSELRQPLGITVIGGLVFSQLLTLYTTPAVYLALDTLQRRIGAALARLRWPRFSRSTN